MGGLWCSSWSSGTPDTKILPQIPNSLYSFKLASFIFHTLSPNTELVVPNQHLSLHSTIKPLLLSSYLPKIPFKEVLFSQVLFNVSAVQRQAFPNYQCQEHWISLLQLLISTAPSSAHPLCPAAQCPEHLPSIADDQKITFLPIFGVTSKNILPNQWKMY